MKKIFISILIGLVLQSSSFMPFEGPYYVNNEGVITKLTNNNSFIASYSNNKYFLCNAKTSTILAFKTRQTNHRFLPLQKTSTCNKQFTILHKKFPYQHSTPYVIDHSGLLFSTPENIASNKGIFELYKVKISLEKGKMILKDFSTNLPVFIFENPTINYNIVSINTITSTSDVKIHVGFSEKISLTKGNKKINFTEALKKHFATLSSQASIEFIHTLPKLDQGSGKDLLPKLYEYTYYSTMLDPLNESEILDVSGFVPKEIEEKNEEGKIIKKTIQSQILGCAKNKKTGNYFYWITDLKQDISVLIQYAE